MNNNEDILQWLQNWYQSQCNGNWEHQYGIRIDTLDNPGWLVEIELNETEWETLKFPRRLIEQSETDWYSIGVDSAKFQGAGDPSKLSAILSKFRDIIEKRQL